MNSLEFHRQGAQFIDPPALAPGTGAEAGATHASPPLATQILTIARRRKWIILGALALCLVAGLVLTLLVTPKFTATTTVEIQRETASFVEVNGGEQKSGGYIDQEFYQTQYGLLKSKALADRVATDLRLYDNVAFLRMFKIGPDEWFSGDRINPRASRREDRIRVSGDVLLGHLKIVPGRLSRLVDIQFTSPDPATSKAVVDMWATDFIRITLERRYGATAYARKFLEQRLEQLRGRIDDSERRLVGYARREGIVNLPGPLGTTGQGTGERSLAADDLVSLNTELASATADRVRAQSRLAAPGGSVTEGLQNSAISGLRQRRAELAADYARLMVQFEPDYPPAKAVKTQLDGLDQSIAREEGRVKNSLTETYESSLARETDLRSRVEKLKAGVLDFRQRSIQYNILQRDVDTSRQLYDALLGRYKEIGVAGGVGINNIAVVDEAELPVAPSSPNLLLNMAAALFAGLVLGVGGALLAEQFDQGIADPSEVEEALGVPLVGTIPKIVEGATMDALNDRKSAINEAYFSLQTNLAFATAHGMPTTIGVTSTRPAEGKSTTSYALAHSIARSKHRAILVDADMRSPSVHGLIGLPNKAGLSNYLSGHDDLASLIHQTDFEGLSVMTAGPQPPSAPELLSGDRFEQLLTALGKQFDHVILDAPPVMGLADAPLIASRVEGTVFVVESGSTQKSMARVALDRLEAAHVALVGVVLTKFDAKRAHYGYGYSYGYGYEYGSKPASR